MVDAALHFVFASWSVIGLLCPDITFVSLGGSQLKSTYMIFWHWASDFLCCKSAQHLATCQRSFIGYVRRDLFEPMSRITVFTSFWVLCQKSIFALGFAVCLGSAVTQVGSSFLGLRPFVMAWVSCREDRFRTSELIWFLSIS